MRAIGPHRSRWSAGCTASEAAASRAGSAAANASVVAGSPASWAMAAVTSAARAGEKNVAGHALRDRAAEQPGRGRHDEQRRDRARPGRLAEHGHQVRVAAERGDVLPDPAQRRHLVEQRPVGRDAGQVGVALDADPVVEGHHHHVLPGQRRAVVADQAGRAEPVATAVDPDHDREPGRAQVGREHVDGEPVVGVGVGRGRRHRREQEPGLRRGRPERGRLPYAVPWPGRARGGEPQVADRGLGERDAAEDGHAVLRPSADQPGGRADHGLGYVHAHPFAGQGRKYPDADPYGRQEGGYATGSSSTTGICRGAAFVSYSAKPGTVSFCLFQIGSRSSGFATRALTLIVSVPISMVVSGCAARL